MLADKGRHPQCGTAGWPCPSKEVVRVWWDLLEASPGVSSPETGSNVSSPSRAMLLIPQACPRGPGCRGKGTLGCQLEALRSSYQELSGDGSLRSENRLFHKAVAGCWAVVRLGLPQQLNSCLVWRRGL